MAALVACCRTRTIQLCDFAALDWDAYHTEHISKEWLLPYAGELAIEMDCGLSGLPRNAPLLELGCGTSSLASDLYNDGWSDVTAGMHCRFLSSAQGFKSSAYM